MYLPILNNNTQNDQMELFEGAIKIAQNIAF